jgi:MoaA/NifB/PqqE/SkfB family radical SAM enzyme
MGSKYFFGMVLRIAWESRKTLIFLLRRRGLRAALNFIYVKLFVPGGEGSGGGAYFFLGPLIKRFPRLAPYPRYVEIEVTTVCNRKCLLCEHTYWKEGEQEMRHLTYEEFKHTVDQFPGLKWTNLTGEGSAFLNPDYIKMIRYLKEKQIPVFLVDHLDSMSEKTMRELIEIGVDGIYVSMDGATKETYEKIKVGCNFDRVVANLRRFLELKQEMKSLTPVFWFRMVLSTLTVHEMPEFIELVNSIGSRERLGPGSYIDFAGLLEFKEIEHLKVPKIPDEIMAATLAKMREHDVHVVLAHSEVEKLPPLEGCIAWMEPYIMMGGYVVPCCSVMMSNRRQWLREHSFGSIFEKPFKDIWYSERYERFRALINRPHGQVPLFCMGCRAYGSTERAQKYGVDEKL